MAQNVPEVVPHVVVVQFEAGVDFHGKTATTGLQVFDRKAATYGVHTIERIFPFLDHVEPTPKTLDNLMALRRTYYVRFRANVIPERVSRDLALAPGIVYAEPVPVNRTIGHVRWENINPNDPRLSDQTELQALKLPEAWEVVKGSDGTPKVVIAIVDGGGEWRHEDLRANVWTNEGETPNNGVDDDGNGHIDDVHGVNFSKRNDNDPTGSRNTPRNVLHGTAVAGAASAVTNNNVGVAGAAWNAEIMHINVGCRNFVDGAVCYGYEGILYAAMNGADIINVSWTSQVASSQDVMHYDQTLNLATDMGALIVAGAGNENYSIDVFRDYPSRHPRVLSVGATQKNSRRKAGFSNYGKLVNVFAPGVGIITTGSNNGYISINGTSFSSPLTTGVAALAKTRFPDMSPDQLREHVRLASENIDAENPGFAGQLGRGFVNALAAVQTPVMPAIRLKNWSWKDHDGDQIIHPGDRVTIEMTVVNHLTDANQLQVELIGALPYSFVQWTKSVVNIGRLASGESAELIFEFTVASNVPANQQVRFFTQVRDRAFEDVTDMVSLRVNRRLDLIHQGLSAFYISTDGDNWIENDNWDITSVPTEEGLDNWFGVVVSEGFLVQLFMEKNNLRGTLPSELENLQNLRILRLSKNEGLSGPIPPELGNLQQLQELELSGNSHSGPIPTELGNLQQLQTLVFSNHSDSGPIPPELGNLQQLQELVLSNNSHSGPIPSELGNLKQLQTLSLPSNSLSGMIPPELGDLEQLRTLSLSSNSFSGSIPPEFGNLEQLQELYLWANSFSGPIPSELGKLEQLQNLELWGNSLSGSIPSELGNLGQLQNLDLSFNSLSGPIPPELGKLSRLNWLDLRRNTFTGRLPRSLMQLDSLEGLLFDGQNLCAPADDEFQMWLKNIPNTLGPTCTGTALHFTSEVSDQSFPRGLPITPLILPEAQGGISPVTYTLKPALPDGLVYDSSTRTISGTPTMVTLSPISYTFRAIDASGATDGIVFSIEVFSPVASEQEELPESFTVYGNYPNPFRESTFLVVDLPWSATLNIDIFDVMGRRVLSQPPVNLTAGWSKNIRLEGSALSSGLYLYRIEAASPVGIRREVGRFVRMR